MPAAVGRFLPEGNMASQAVGGAVAIVTIWPSCIDFAYPTKTGRRRGVRPVYPEENPDDRKRVLGDVVAEVLAAGIDEIHFRVENADD
jgi:hypothetical protein